MLVHNSLSDFPFQQSCPNQFQCSFFSRDYLLDQAFNSHSLQSHLTTTKPIDLNKWLENESDYKNRN